MRVRDHLLLSTAATAALFPFLGRRVAPAWAASILIDADHYLWFVANERRLDPVAALQRFNEAQPPPASDVRWFHHPAALAVVAALASRRRSLLPVALGMAGHVALDVYHDARLRRVRAAVLRRDFFRCQECRVQDETVTVHTRRQPFLLPSYKLSNFVALCGRCHQAAHNGGVRVEPERALRAAGRRG